MYKVKKREGKIVEFDLEKIKTAMKKAFAAENKNTNDDIIDFMVLKVTADF